MYGNSAYASKTKSWKKLENILNEMKKKKAYQNWWHEVSTVLIVICIVIKKIESFKISVLSILLAIKKKNKLNPK